MAAAKTVHTLKPAVDVIADTPANAAPPHQFQQAQQHLRHDHDRRRLSVSEKLAEGRGFWRGVFVGVSFGAVAGITGSVTIANIWIPQVMDVVQQSVAIERVFSAEEAAGAQGLTVTPTGGEIATDEAVPGKVAQR